MTAIMKENVGKIISTYLNNKAFTACAVGVSSYVGGEINVADLYRGTTGRHSTDVQVDKKSLFDVASLTKPLVTLLSLLSLIRQGKADFSEKIESLLACKVPQDKKNITLLHLIGHMSGLPAHRQYYEKTAQNSRLDGNRICRWILDEPLESAPGERYIYSDLGYILLGRIVEHKSGEGIAAYWRREIVEPLALDDEFHIYGETSVAKEKYVSTGCNSFDEDDVYGQVHDENCRAAGRILGHAGLFSTLHGVVSLCNCILLSCLEFSGHPAYRDKDMHFLLEAGVGGQWACGFDVRTGREPSSGTLFSEKTIGHLGFTGTSMWIDIQKRISVVLLTNRVIHGLQTNTLQYMRPLLHDAVMRSFSSKII
ncbi:MAG TPA: serine hydrolase domain-containing protein [Desulfopila sp.]|nr:serine hydrolase domain-containing protein [Desulfopila sp.]